MSDVLASQVYKWCMSLRISCGCKVDDLKYLLFYEECFALRSPASDESLSHPYLMVVVSTLRFFLVKPLILPWVKPDICNCVLFLLSVFIGC